MMLAGPTLRTVPVTTHVPLARRARTLLGIELIVAKGRAAVARPAAPVRDRASRASRSPASIPMPARAARSAARRSRSSPRRSSGCARRAIDVDRPASAPTPCSTRARAPRYDAALCMYHDQALIPLRRSHFDEGVNITLGLPIVRTSPDHGTAFDIAGKDLAEPGAMIAAIRMAGRCAAARSPQA